MREVVVVAREDAPGDQRIVAYVAPAAGASPLPAELRAVLQERLPEYMVPSAFVVLDALPLTASGKIDRRALPAPEAAAVGERTAVAPRGPIEAALASIFSEVLAVPRSARTTASSIAAGTRSWRRGSWPAPARRSQSISRSAPSSMRPRRRSSRRASRPRSGRGTA